MTNASSPTRRRHVQLVRRSTRPSVLCLLPCVPWPADTGGRLRTLTMMQALDRTFDLTVLCWRGRGQDLEGFRRLLQGRVIASEAPGGVDARAADAVGAALGRPLGYQRYTFPPRLLRAVLALQRFDAIHFDHPHTALLAGLVRRLQPDARLVLDAHNVEAEIVERIAGDSPGWKRPVLRWHARRVRALEGNLAASMDLVLACSDRDAAQFRALGAAQVRVVPNGVPPVSRAPGDERRDVLFVGSLDWRPNIDAALTLAGEIWPKVRDRLPGARLVLVGRNPPRQVRELAGPDVVVTGSVETVVPWLRSARLTAIPLRAGSGTRIKILEAWASGVPVIASRVAAEGLPATDGDDLLLAETPDEFAAAIERVFHDELLGQRLAAGGLKAAEPFSQAAVERVLVEAYRDALARRAGARALRYRRAYAPAIAASS